MWAWKLLVLFLVVIRLSVISYQCAFCQCDLQEGQGRSRMRAVAHTSRFLVQAQHPNLNRGGEQLPWHGMPACGPVWGVVCWHDHGHIDIRRRINERETRNTKRGQSCLALLVLSCVFRVYPKGLFRRLRGPYNLLLPTLTDPQNLLMVVGPPPSKIMDGYGPEAPSRLSMLMTNRLT